MTKHLQSHKYIANRGAPNLPMLRRNVQLMRDDHQFSTLAYLHQNGSKRKTSEVLYSIKRYSTENTRLKYGNTFWI